MEWTRKVGEVFNSRPRDKTSPETKVWLPRDKKEREVTGHLFLPGVNICIDGPSGTGKTSIAYSALGVTKIPYVVVPFYRDMTWEGFCKELVKKPQTKTETSVSAGLEMGLMGGLPSGKFQVALGRTVKTDIPVDEVAKTWTVGDVSDLMVKEGITVLIDDFERATNEMIVKISDVAKHLTEKPSKRESKLLIVGMGDIYARLFKENRSLEGRFHEITLGGFEDRNESWRYLTLGFDCLGLRHPGNTSLRHEQIKLPQCIEEVYKAADSLPKTLTKLGADIALRCFERTGVTAFDIVSSAKSLLHQRIDDYQLEFPNLDKELAHDRSARFLLRQLIAEGVSKPHRWSTIQSKLDSTLAREEQAEALQKLVRMGILVQTGPHKDVIFFQDLSFMHTIQSIVENPREFNQENSEYPSLRQLRLPLMGMD